MKPRALQLLCLIGMVLVSLSGWGQDATVYFTYDNCGNRVSRHLKLAKLEENGRYIEDTTAFLGMASDIIGSIDISLFPNPTADIVTVTLSDVTPAPMEAILTTVTGTVVEHHRFNDLRHEFDLSSQPAGVYLLKLILIDETRTWKIVKH